MVFDSDAGIQKILLLVIMAIIFVYIVELILRKPKLSNIALVAMVIGIIAVIIILYSPVMGMENADIVLSVFQGKLLDYRNMHSRYAAWNEVIQLAGEQGIINQLIGNSLSVGAGGSIYVESLYVKTYYAIGWFGIFGALGFLIGVIKYIIMVKDRKTFYLMIIMVILLLGSGIAINSMERVQMSWFPMLFAGMVVSSVREEGKENTY